MRATRSACASSMCSVGSAPLHDRMTTATCGRGMRDLKGAAWFAAVCRQAACGPTFWQSWSAILGRKHAQCGTAAVQTAPA